MSPRPPTILGILRTSVFCQNPHAGKNLSRQYQGGSQSVLSKVASFFLPTDIPRTKGSLWKVEWRRKSFAVWRDVRGPLRKGGTSLTLRWEDSKAMWGWDSCSLFLFHVSMLLLFLCDSLSQFVLIFIPLFWLQPHSPVLFHQPTARLPATLASWLSGPSPFCFDSSGGRGGDDGYKANLLVTFSFPFPGLKPPVRPPLLGSE